jgi:uncharacterized repeat protein (TIGR01451 family)
VFDNDTLNAAALNPADITATLVSALPAGLSFDPATGVVGVAAGTAAGTPSFEYRICENANPANCDTATVTVTVALPALTLDKTAVLDDSVVANGTADAGETISYTLIASNAGGLALEAVSISDPRLPTLTCAPVQPAVLAPGESLQCSGSYLVTQSDVDFGAAISNTATATATPPGSPVLSANDSALVPVSGAVPAIALDKVATLLDTVQANGTADAGESIAYSLTATNTGSVTLDDVTIVDSLLPVLSCTPAQPASLAPGASMVCSGSILVTQANVDAGQPLVNTAIASGTPTGGSPVSATDSTSTPVTGGAPAITLAKQAQLNETVTVNGTADAGETIDYTLTATNSGALSLSAVTISDPRLPLLACTPAQPVDLAPGSSLQCTGSYTVTQADIDARLAIFNTATASGTPPSGPPVEAEDTAVVPVTEGFPAIRLVKRAILDDSVLANGLADADETIHYTLTATNIGGFTLSDMAIVDPLLASLACSPAQPVSRAPGASIECSGSHTVSQAEVDAGEPIVNTATASGQPPVGEPVSDSDSTSTAVGDGATPPQIGVAKALSGLTGIGPYDIQFTIVVANLGGVALEQLQIVEDLRQTFPLPSTFSLLSLSAIGTVQINPDFDGIGDTGLLLPAASTLAVDAQATITLRLRLAANGASGPFENTVTASGQSALGVVVSDDSVDGLSPDPGSSGPTPITLPPLLPAAMAIPFASVWGLLLLAVMLLLAAALPLRTAARQGVASKRRE